MPPEIVSNVFREASTDRRGLWPIRQAIQQAPKAGCTVLFRPACAVRNARKSARVHHVLQMICRLSDRRIIRRGGPRAVRGEEPWCLVVLGKIMCRPFTRKWSTGHMPQLCARISSGILRKHRRQKANLPSNMVGRGRCIHRSSSCSVAARRGCDLQAPLGAVNASRRPARLIAAPRRQRWPALCLVSPAQSTIREHSGRSSLVFRSSDHDA
jgi:hypothetical protein